eukprot:TRINITY_DN76206_c0_g1_i2.p1 TRINITY_DN76206_c0_g1~~TRINITY_DN76206_c0_g1_i2.p1  ORF type:complete len:412 (+),score=62.59 TRINITY_DN76206_c0_g1_i2:72-1307(+)
MIPSSPSRPRSAPPGSARSSFLYASTWMKREAVQDMYDQEFHASIDGFGEKSVLCTRTVDRRIKKLVASGLPLRDWTQLHVLDWLTYSGMEQHRELFRRAAVDGRVLSKLSFETLRTKVGMRSLGHRKHLCEEIKQLKAYLSQNSIPSSPPRSAGPAGVQAQYATGQGGDLASEELLSQLRSQRERWVADRQHLMRILNKRLSFLTEPLEEWTVEQVCDWIDHLGLSTYRRIFAHGSIDGKILSKMTMGALDREVGVACVEHRRFLMSQIRKLATQEHYERQESGGSCAEMLTREQRHQVQGQMRECDFNIIRIDQRMEKLKKRLGVDTPKTNEYHGAQQRAEEEKSRMEESSKHHDKNWWDRHFEEHEKKQAELSRKREKAVHEELKKPIPSRTCRGEYLPSAIFRGTPR